MPHTKLRPHFVFDEEKIEKLKNIAPEAFSDGKVNWEVLKESLGEFAEDDGPDVEHFGLFCDFDDCLILACLDKSDLNTILGMDLATLPNLI
jgi:hypothetical protein